ncbi:Sodium/glucose cotransporter [Rubripirellula lacrimiformis]|uniref:Sodium/glucose cotransporter n=1 Tax=Rubripirellula lacrimiformis TaxID=1930273 RepID=A0A517N4D0_9BACT|nr:sodium:solute symporter [Rubripirellula lacrimiformis]QDT01858.1 Sodium/glucose cotransporter [Rubripirellula lacrimiformis]
MTGIEFNYREESVLAIHPIDATIVVVYVAAMIAFGVWLGRGQKNLSGYLLGNRDLPWWAILGSIVATETSTATFLSVPGIAFAQDGDMRFLQLAIGFLLGRVIVSYVFLPRYFEGNLYTAYEVLDRRFGGATKQTASLLFLVTRNLGDGLRLFLAGIALEKVLGIDLVPCIVVIGVATIVYTFVGGMKAVIWSDCIQFVVYMIGGILAFWILVGSFDGGWDRYLEFGSQTGRFDVLDFRWRTTDTFFLLNDPYTFWAGLVGGIVLTLGTHGTDQMMVQRYLCARNQRDASRALIASGFVVLCQFALFLALGVALALFYTDVQPQTFERGDEVFAAFIVDHLPMGLLGLTLAAVFSAAMSTLSSSLNSSATAAVNDFYVPWTRKGQGNVDDSDSSGLLKVSRRMTVFFGVLQIIIGIGASYLSTSVVGDALAIAGFTAGILLGIFALGIFTTRANQRGALFGMLAGILVLTSIKFGTSVAWPWFAVAGSFTTFTVGYAASCLLPVSPIKDPR